MAETKVPDGGYGWVIMMCTMFMLTLWSGSFASFGVLFTPFVEYFEESKTVVAWIAAFKLGTQGLVGIIVGPLIRTFGPKKITIVGSSLISTGYICSIFAPSALVLYFTYGLIPGFGYGCYIVCAPVAVQQYFDKKRSFALGFTMCGISLGSFGFPPLTAFLLDHFGWRGTILILAAIQLHGIMCGALLRPLVCNSNHSDQQNETITKPEITESVDNHDNKEQKQDAEKSTLMPDSISSESEEHLQLQEHPCLDFCKSVIDISLFKNVPFMIYCLGIYLQKMGHFSVVTFLPVRGLSTGVDRQMASYLLSILGVCGGVGRITFGFVADKIGSKRIYLTGIAVSIGGFLCALSPLYQTYWSLAVFSGLFGLVSSIYIIMEIGCIVDLWGREVLAKANGIIMVFIGLCNLTGTPLTGFLMDITASTSIPFLVLGTAQICGGVLMGVGSALQRHRNLQSTPKDETVTVVEGKDANNTT